MTFPRLFGLTFFWSFAVVLLALSLGACSTIGKAPVYRQPVAVIGLDPYRQTITVVEPVSYYRTPSCRHYGNPEADGFYGCAESHQQ